MSDCFDDTLLNVKHPAARGVSAAYFHQVGAIIAEAAAPDLPSSSTAEARFL
ncbi:MAG: hypothetical protein MUC34_19980 [Anaerolineae bacterium]|jgi:hypothetical protein|nr:hypothetical protein [Anaerolineae bacterium]